MIRAPMPMSSVSASRTYTYFVPVFAAIVSVKGITIAGYGYTGFVWYAYLLLGFLLLFLKKRRVFFPVFLWLPWFCYVTLTLSWSSMTLRPNLQTCLQIITPFIVGIIASYSITEEHHWRTLAKFFTVSMFLIAIAFLIYWYGLDPASLDGQSRGFVPRPAAMSLTIIAGIYLSRFPKIGLPQVIGWVSCLSICLLTGSRTATAVTASLWLFLPKMRHVWQRAVILVFVATLATYLFNSPIFQNRFFYSGQGQLGDIFSEEFDDAGRFVAWEAIIQASKEHILFGAGVGESPAFVYKYFAPMKYIHNDYLRILYETGIFGLALFLAALSAQLGKLWRMFSLNAQSIAAREAASSAILALIAWSLFSFTDNGLIYGPAFTHPIFALLGAASGLSARTRSNPRPQTRTQ